MLAGARQSLPDAEILDEMKLARGASSAFNAATAFAFERLADLSEGLATITDSTLSVKGTALTPEAYDRARRAFREELPSAVTLGPVDITAARAEPFVWSASYDGEAVTHRRLCAERRRPGDAWWQRRERRCRRPR